VSTHDQVLFFFQPLSGLSANGLGLFQGAMLRPMLTGEEQAGLMAQVVESRDRTAFSSLLRHFAPRVKGYLLRRGASEAQVDDVLQDVMLTIWSRAAQYDPAKSGLSTWVFTIARNRWVDRIRKECRPEVDKDDPAWVPNAPDAPDTALFASRDQHRIAQALASLPDEQATIIRLRYFDGISQAVIAEDLSLPLGTVKSRARLALKQLRELLTTDDGHTQGAPV